MIEVPKRVNGEQEEILRQLAKLEKVDTKPHKRSFFDKLKDLFTED